MAYTRDIDPEDNPRKKGKSDYAFGGENTGGSGSSGNDVNSEGSGSSGNAFFTPFTPQDVMTFVPREKTTVLGKGDALRDQENGKSTGSAKTMMDNALEEHRQKMRNGLARKHFADYLIKPKENSDTDKPKDIEAKPPAANLSEGTDLLSKLANMVVSPEEIERRERRVRALEGVKHLGNILSSFGNLHYARAGGISQGVELPKSEIDGWREKQRSNLESYQKLLAEQEKRQQDYELKALAYEDRHRQITAYADRATQAAKESASREKYWEEKYNQLVASGGAQAEIDAAKAETEKARAEKVKAEKKAADARAEASRAAAEASRAKAEAEKARADKTRSDAKNNTSEAQNRNRNRDERTRIAAQNRGEKPDTPKDEPKEEPKKGLSKKKGKERKSGDRVGKGRVSGKLK